MTSSRPRSASSSRRAGSLRVLARPTPSRIANTITASMSPSAIALTAFAGTRFTTKSTPLRPAALAAAGRRAPSPIGSRSAGSRPVPGSNTFTSVTPIATAIVDTATV